MKKKLQKGQKSKFSIFLYMVAGGGLILQILVQKVSCGPTGRTSVSIFFGNFAAKKGWPAGSLAVVMEGAGFCPQGDHAAKVPPQHPSGHPASLD